MKTFKTNLIAGCLSHNGNMTLAHSYIESAARLESAKSFKHTTQLRKVLDMINSE